MKRNGTQSRSRLVEDAAREFLAPRARAAREARDLAILNEAADALNARWTTFSPTRSLDQTLSVALALA